MKNLKRSTFALSILIALLVAGCRDKVIDGHIIKLDDGRIIELQHKLGDVYLAHEIDAEKAEKVFMIKKGN